ncbi:MAG TPA: DNA methyltransferase [archaeon]|nr:DNA methyltransferase [archaeon]
MSRNYFIIFLDKLAIQDYYFTMDYQDFLKSKIIKQSSMGKEKKANEIHPMLFDFQRDVTLWALKKGRAAVFLDTGLGKTFVQLEWARLIDEKTLIIAPLSVARQTVREARKIDINLDYVRDQSQIKNKISITNYEMIDSFDFSKFKAVVLDESSILKAIGGQTKRKLIKICKNIPYKLSCTATPAPNDYIELGNQVEWLGICKQSEMLAMFFVNANKEHTYTDGKTTFWKKGSNKAGTEWRIKHHAESAFFRWLASWAIALTKPSDLGYSDDGFILPPLNLFPKFIHAEYQPEDQLFFTHIKGIKDAHGIRRQTIPKRLELLTGLINGNNEQWIIWTGLTEESKQISKEFEGSIEVRGDHDSDYKAKSFEDFQDGKYKILITKPKIGGFGMNFQNAHNMAFFGLNYSWESFYQCIRRQWRYMQKSPVNVHIIMSDIESSIYQNVMRKDAMAKRLRSKLIDQIKDFEMEEIKMEDIKTEGFDGNKIKGKGWVAIHGDSCEELKKLDEKSVDLSVYSPPFADLYTYTNSERDLGNSRNWDEFFLHYAFIIQDVLRVTKPGRLTCVHVSDIPAMAQKDGYIGVRDFPGAVIAAYKKEGWIFNGRAFIQKNPQAQAIRTHSKALLFVQLRKDSADSRPALVDQILIFKKPGENEVPVLPVENEELDNETWILWANGIWTGISETDTLQYTRARAADDEKHICPLQLGTIERCIKLYSNPGETVLTPFGGIGSEAFQAIRYGRKAILIELKTEYFNEAIKNIKHAESLGQQDLFSGQEEKDDETIKI